MYSRSKTIKVLIHVHIFGRMETFHPLVTTVIIKRHFQFRGPMDFQEILISENLKRTCMLRHVGCKLSHDWS